MVLKDCVFHKDHNNGGLGDNLKNHTDSIVAATKKDIHS